MYTFLQYSKAPALCKQYHKFSQVSIGNSPKFLPILQYFLQEWPSCKKVYFIVKRGRKFFIQLDKPMTRREQE